jgi:RNA polymerase-associated protein RTF1
VAPSSPGSIGSGAMDESDSEADDAPPPRDAHSDVPYPLEGKYVNSSDKARILAMSQLDREEILGQRAEEMSRVNFQAEVARRAANMQNSANRKRKADSEEPDSPRKSSRQVKPKTTSGLEAYKRDREQRGQQRQIRDDRDDDRRNGRRRSSSGDRDRSDVDAEGESDVDWDEERKPVVREEQPAGLQHIESVRVGRGFFGVVCFYPGFEEAMTGTFGRIGVGQDAQRNTLYKMAQIKGMLSSPLDSFTYLTLAQASPPVNLTFSKARTASVLRRIST